MKTEQPQCGRSAMNGSHHPSSITPDSNREQLSDKAFYLIAMALLLNESAEPGSLKQYLVPVLPLGSQSSSGQIPIRG